MGFIVDIGPWVAQGVTMGKRKQVVQDHHSGNPIVLGGCVVHHLLDKRDGSLSSSLEESIVTSQMRAAVDCLERLGQDGSWLVFMLNTPYESTKTDDRCLNLQYSIDVGRLGIDWVLLGPRNVADREKVTRFARRRGHKVRKVAMCDVPYLRMEDGDLRGLGRAIAEDLYGMSVDSDIGLMVSGILLPAGWHSAQ